MRTTSYRRLAAGAVDEHRETNRVLRSIDDSLKELVAWLKRFVYAGVLSQISHMEFCLHCLLFHSISLVYNIKYL